MTKERRRKKPKIAFGMSNNEFWGTISNWESKWPYDEERDEEHEIEGDTSQEGM